jgi:hypothetical protein
MIEIFTDGACSGNPGPGGWGAILRKGDTEKELFGGETLTTNNRMEMTAVIEALRALKAPVRGARAYRFAVCAEGHQRMDPRLEAARLENREQGSGEERGPVARTGPPRGAAQDRMDLGQGPRRTP